MLYDYCVQAIITGTAGSSGREDGSDGECFVQSKMSLKANVKRTNFSIPFIYLNIKPNLLNTDDHYCIANFCSSLGSDGVAHTHTHRASNNRSLHTQGASILLKGARRFIMEILWLP